MSWEQHLRVCTCHAALQVQEARSKQQGQSVRALEAEQRAGQLRQEVQVCDAAGGWVPWPYGMHVPWPVHLVEAVV